MTLLPPIVASSMPAIAANSDLKLYFSFPSTMNNKNPNVRIEYSVALQTTNKSVLVNAQTLRTDYQSDNKGYFILIPQSNILDGWLIGGIYKVQIRLADKKSKDVSEWSTVCYIKATAPESEISVKILNAAEEGSVQFAESPKFMGQYLNPQDPSETQIKYKFDLYDYNNKNLIESTGWLAHLSFTDRDEVVFSQNLVDFNRYIVSYSIETKNGYIKTVEYNFLCSFGMLESATLYISGETNEEEACITLHITSDESLSTNLILRRTDSRSNFTKWEDYKYFNILDRQADEVFNDYLVENGINYMYGIQEVSSEGYRTNLIKTAEIPAYYEHMYLVGNDKQLKIKYNPKISSWKRQIQEAKTDTIGSKYPFIVRSGAVNYFTFPISGLISYHADEAEAFCSKNLLCVSSQITTDSEVNVNPDNTNIIKEREFRNQVEEFLTNGDFKYFKSATEGVKLIALTAVSLSPNDTLGRMLYTFSGTAYEMGEVSLTNLLNSKVVNQGEYISVDKMGISEHQGILTLRVSQFNEDLYAKIKAQIDADLGTYLRKMRYLKSIRIEIMNPALVSDTYAITLKLSENGTNNQVIKISKNIGLYELEDVVKIYGLYASQTQIQLMITYTAVCGYEQKEIDVPVIGNYEAVSNFCNIYTIFNTASNNMDIFNVIKNNEKLTRLLNLTYLRIDAPAGTALMINDQNIIIGDTNSLEYRDIAITSASFITPAAASVTAIYNGFRYA